jgi:hypothetical protein
MDDAGQDAGQNAVRSAFRPLHRFGIVASVLGVSIVVVAFGKGAKHVVELTTSVESLIQKNDDCTPNGQNCRKAKCCSEPGMTCFEKNEHWASCNQTCSPNMLWTGKGHNGWEESKEKVWNCTAISETPDCSKDGHDCRETKCCQHPDSKCYMKNDHWASCNNTCSSKMKWVGGKWTEQTDKVWDCAVLSCVENGHNCAASKCCSEPGMTCFKKNDHWASCNKTCSSNMMWKDGAWENQSTKIWDCEVLSPE